MKIVVLFVSIFITALAQDKKLNNIEQAKKLEESMVSQLVKKESILYFINVRNHDDMVTGKLVINDNEFEVKDSKVSIPEDAFSLEESERVEAYFVSEAYVNKKIEIYHTFGSVINPIFYVIDKKYPERIQILLTWTNQSGQYDLDSHLKSQKFHIYYANKSAWGSMQSRASLDKDVVSEQAYEIITIDKPAESENYEYFVNNYSGKQDWLKMGIKVDVYMDNQLIDQFHTSANNQNTSLKKWYVFRIQKQGREAKLITVNQLGN